MPPFPQNGHVSTYPHFLKIAILVCWNGHFETEDIFFINCNLSRALKHYFWYVKLYLNYFPHSKMAISEHKNGHFEEIRGWLQILELGYNSTIFHLLFDTYDSPGAVFIWKWEKYRPYLLVCTLYGVVHKLRGQDEVGRWSVKRPRLST